MFNFKNFFVSSFIFSTIVLISILLYPPATKENLSLDKNNKLSVNINYTSYIIIIIANILILLWLSSSNQKPKLLSTEKILIKPEVQQQLITHSLTYPMLFTHRQYIGEFSIGHLYILATKNNENKTIYILHVADEDYATRNTKPSLESPILAVTSHFEGIKEALRTLPPTERGTLETRLKQFVKEVKRQDAEYYKTALEKAKKEAEEELEGEL